MRHQASKSAVIVIIQLVTSTLSLTTPPDITFPERPLTEFHKESATVYLNCTASGNPQPRYSWNLNGNNIVSNDIIKVDEKTGVLTIKGFTKREEGAFQCLATNSITSNVNPTAVSSVITLLKVGIGQSTDGEAPLPVKKNEGDYAALHCVNAPQSVPSAKFSWFNSINKEQIVETDRVFVDNTGTLHFVYLEVSDDRRGGTNPYKCGMFNSIVDSIQLTSPTELWVTPDAKNQVKPKLQYRTAPARFPRTRTAELECIFSGYPIPTVTWKDKLYQEVVPNSKYEFDPKSFNRRLRIKHLEEGDGGMYTCIGKNTLGKVQGTVFLEVTSGPIWTEGLSYQTVPAGMDARFTCKARKPIGSNFNPLNTPVWYKDAQLLNPGNAGGRFEFSEATSVLTVKNVRKLLDTMCFQCNVSNEFGFEFDNACLNVIEPITIVQRPAEVQTIKKGGAVDLTVIGATDPDLVLKYRWRFRNITYDRTHPPHVTYDPTTMEAYINTSSLTDEELERISGVYYRYLYHDYQTVVVETRIVVEQTTAVPILQEAAFPWWVVIFVVVLVFLIVAVIIIVLLCCRQKDKGDYYVYQKELKSTYLDPNKDIEENKFHDVARIESDPEDVKRPLRSDNDQSEV